MAGESCFLFAKNGCNLLCTSVGFIMIVGLVTISILCKFDAAFSGIVELLKGLMLLGGPNIPTACYRSSTHCLMAPI
jgi:hypothetical protein